MASLSPEMPPDVRFAELAQKPELMMICHLLMLAFRHFHLLNRRNIGPSWAFDNRQFVPLRMIQTHASDELKRGAIAGPPLPRFNRAMPELTRRRSPDAPPMLPKNAGTFITVTVTCASARSRSDLAIQPTPAVRISLTLR
jgi:hypothetical protein